MRRTPTGARPAWIASTSSTSRHRSTNAGSFRLRSSARNQRGQSAVIPTPRGQNPTGGAVDAERAALLREVLALSAGERYRFHAPPGISITTIDLEPNEAEELATATYAG